MNEAQETALLLRGRRAGGAHLIADERVVGPRLGAENIARACAR